MKTVVKQKQKRPGLALFGYFSALFMLFFVSEVAFGGSGGQTVGDVAEHVTGSMKGLQKLLGAAAYIAGLGFGIAGVMKFKAHKDNPTQVPLSQPITLILIAAGLVFLPSLITTAGSTIFADGKSGDAEGGGFD